MHSTCEADCSLMREKYMWHCERMQGKEHHSSAFLTTVKQRRWGTGPMPLCSSPFLSKLCCVPFPCGWDTLWPGQEDCVLQSHCVPVPLCTISMGLGHTGTRTQKTDLSLCAPVPLCTSPIVSCFHGAGTHWDQDTDDWFLHVYTSPMCPISMELEYTGTRKQRTDLSLCTPVPCVPFPWVWDTLGSGCRRLICPSVLQSHVSHFHGAGTHWDQAAEDWPLHVCTSPNCHCVQVPFCPVILCTIPVVSQFYELVPLWAPVPLCPNSIMCQSHCLLSCLFMSCYEVSKLQGLNAWHSTACGWHIKGSKVNHGSLSVV